MCICVCIVLYHVLCVFVCMCMFINKRGAYSLFHWDLIFVQDSKLFMDERNLSFRLGQISLKSLQELQALTKLSQTLGGLSQSRHTQSNKHKKD